MNDGFNYYYYQGVGPTSQRAGVVAGVLLPSYDFFKKTLLQSGAPQYD